jgi:hypothetical protein
MVIDDGKVSMIDLLDSRKASMRDQQRRGFLRVAFQDCDEVPE